MIEITDEQIIEAISNASSNFEFGQVDMKMVYDELRALIGKNIPLWVFQTKIWKMNMERKLDLARGSSVFSRTEKYGIHRSGGIYMYIYNLQRLRDAETE